MDIVFLPNKFAFDPYSSNVGYVHYFFVDFILKFDRLPCNVGLLPLSICLVPSTKKNISRAPIIMQCSRLSVV